MGQTRCMMGNLNLSKDQINVTKRISHVLFDSSDVYHKSFAKHLCESDFSVLDSWYKAYYKVNKIRAAQLLEDPFIWKEYFRNLKDKKVLSPNEKRKLEAFDHVIDALELDPFDLYVYYVENHKEIKKPISAILSSDLIKDIQVLFYLYNFFEILKREHFLKQVKIRIAEEIASIKLLRDEELNYRLMAVKRRCKKDGIDIEEILGYE